MTKSSSGAKCKVQQVRVRVEVAPALSGRESVEEGRCGWKGQVSPENSSSKSSNSSHLFHARRPSPPFGSSPSPSA